MDDRWRMLDGELAAWFDASSHAAGARLVEASVALADCTIDMDVRAGGVRVRLRTEDAAVSSTIADAAEALGLVAAPHRLRSTRLVLETSDPARDAPFWALALGAVPEPGDDGVRLTDPLRRTPPLLVVHDPEQRTLRERLHVDVVRPQREVGALVDAVGPAGGPYGVRLADPAGVEVDAVPGAPLPGAEDWWTLFAAQSRWRTPTRACAATIVRAAAERADAAGERLGIDVRRDGVVLDGGKDAWEDEQGERAAFVALAASIADAARAAGATSDPSGLRLVQLGVDAVDVPAARRAWGALLAARPDPRPHVTDLVDPLGIGPVVFVQPTGADDAARLAQRPRLRVDVRVPSDALDARVDAAVAAGWAVRDRTSDAALLADPGGALASLSRD